MSRIVECDDDGSDLRPVRVDMSTRAYLAAMWQRRSFAFEVPLEELRTAHRTTLLGNVWHLFNPALMIAVYYLVFGTIMAGSKPDNFLVWLTIGLFAFRFTQASVLGASATLEAKAGLVRTIRFPRALLPTSVVTREFLSFAIELSVMAALVIGSGFGVTLRWLALPLVLLIHTGLNLGLALVAARLADTFRDTQQLLPFLFRLLLYLSGVIVPVERFVTRGESTALAVIALDLNPVKTVIDTYRWMFLGTDVGVMALARTASVSLVALTVGFVYFRRAEWRYGR